MKAQEAEVKMQVVVKDKHGNVKYSGPLVMKQVKEQENGRNPLERREKRSG